MIALHSTPALLALADGRLFYGTSLGCAGQTVGEVVFNTAMTGYQEILTDPSYARQIVTLTYPHIGNVGCNADDVEAKKIWASGLIIRDGSMTMSNWRGQVSLQDYLQQEQVVAIADIDTRQLTQLLRDGGVQNGCITTKVDDPDKAVQAARQCPSLKGVDLARVVSTDKVYSWADGVYSFEEKNEVARPALANQPHVVVYDFGVKQNILRLLVDRGCQVTVVPAMTTASDVLALQPQGVLLSNGPGDPAACDYAIEAVRDLLEKNMPLFGICLGCQLLGLALGAKTRKMNYGHHGSNHPVQTDQKTVAITSQNHGFVIDEMDLPGELIITHRSLFDGTIQGIRHAKKSAFAIQCHPEASPGPHDLQGLFDQFLLTLSPGNIRPVDS